MSYKNCDAARKAQSLAERLGIPVDAARLMKRNPFAKRLWLSLGFLVVSIGVSVVCGIIVKNNDLDQLNLVGPVLIGMASCNVADALLRFLSFRKLKKLTNTLQ